MHASKDSTAKLENYSNYFATDLNENEMGPKKISWSEKYKLFPQGNCLFLSRAARKGPASYRKAQKVGSVTFEFNKGKSENLPELLDRATLLNIHNCSSILVEK